MPYYFYNNRNFYTVMIMQSALVLPAPMDPQAHFFYTAEEPKQRPREITCPAEAPKPVAKPGAEVKIYVAGGSRGWPGPGGWAALLIAEKNGRVFDKMISGKDRNTNTYKMTITALLEGLSLLRRPVSVEILSVQKWLAEHLDAETLCRHMPDGRSPSEAIRLLGQHQVQARWLSKEIGNPMMERVRSAAHREASLALAVA